MTCAIFHKDPGCCVCRTLALIPKKNWFMSCCEPSLVVGDVQGTANVFLASKFAHKIANQCASGVRTSMGPI